MRPAPILASASAVQTWKERLANAMPTEGLHGYPMPAEALHGYPMPPEALRGYPMPAAKPAWLIPCRQKPCVAILWLQKPARSKSRTGSSRYQQGGDELPVMLFRAPRAAPFASPSRPSAGERGLQLFRDYIAIQASNQYPIYRDLSLYKLVPSIVRHPDERAALRLLLELAKAALSGGELEFAEPAMARAAGISVRRRRRSAIRGAPHRNGTQCAHARGGTRARRPVGRTSSPLCSSSRGEVTILSGDATQLSTAPAHSRALLRYGGVRSSHPVREFTDLPRPNREHPK